MSRAGLLLGPALLSALLAGCTLDYGGLGSGGAGGGGDAQTGATSSTSGVGTGGTGGSGLRCDAGLGVYDDTFDVDGPGFWSSFNAEFSIAGGALTLSMAPAEAGGVFRQAEARATGAGSPRGLDLGCAVEIPMPTRETAWGGLGIREDGGSGAWILWADGEVVELWASNDGSDVRVTQGNLADPRRLRLRHQEGGICAEVDNANGVIPLGCFAAQGWESGTAVLLLTLEEKVSGGGGKAVFAGVGPGS